MEKITFWLKILVFSATNMAGQRCIKKKIIIIFWHMVKISRGFTFGSPLSASCQDIEIFWSTCKNLVFILWRQWMFTKFHVRHFTKMSDISLKAKKRQPHGGVRVKAEGKRKTYFNSFSHLLAIHQIAVDISVRTNWQAHTTTEPCCYNSYKNTL